MCLSHIFLVIFPGRPQLLEKWISEDKLEMSEELGDLLMPADVNMALTVYQRANIPEKVINCLMQKGESDKIVAYSMSVGYRVDYTFMLQQLVRTNPQVKFAFPSSFLFYYFYHHFYHYYYYLLFSNMHLNIHLIVNIFSFSFFFLFLRFFSFFSFSFFLFLSFFFLFLFFSGCPRLR